MSSSSVWIVDQVKEITVVTNETVNLRAFYTLGDSSTYTEIPGPFTQNGDRYYLSTSFSTPDRYFIRVIDYNNNMVEQVAQIDVVASPDLTVADLLDTGIHVHNTPGTIGDAMHRITYLEQYIYVNTELGVNGDGSQIAPFNNITDAKDECEARGISRLMVIGDVTLTGSLKNLNVTGIGTPRINLNGQDVRNTSFYQCSLTGNYINTIVVRDSILEAGLYLNGFFENCGIQGDVTIVADAYAMLSNCMNITPTATTCNISMNSGAASTLTVQNFSGDLSISEMDNIGDQASVYMSQGELLLTSSNIAGTIHAEGVGELVDFTNGTTVYSNLLNVETISAQVKPDIEASTVLAKESTVTTAQNAIQTDISNLNDVTVAEIWAGSTVDLTPVLTAISALNNLSLLDIEGSTVLAKEATLGVIATSIAAIPTTDSVADLTPVLTAISGLNDVTPAEVRAAFNAADFKDKNTELEIHTWLDSYVNKDNWKADINAIPDAVWGKVV